jgi:hypothetical protein
MFASKRSEPLMNAPFQTGWAVLYDLRLYTNIIYVMNPTPSPSNISTDTSEEIACYRPPTGGRHQKVVAALNARKGIQRPKPN